MAAARAQVERAMVLGRALWLDGKKYKPNSFLPLSKLTPKRKRQLVELRRIRILPAKPKGKPKPATAAAAATARPVDAGGR